LKLKLFEPSGTQAISSKGVASTRNIVDATSESSNYIGSLAASLSQTLANPGCRKSLSAALKDDTSQLRALMVGADVGKRDLVTEVTTMVKSIAKGPQFAPINFTSVKVLSEFGTGIAEAASSQEFQVDGLSTDNQAALPLIKQFETALLDNLWHYEDSCVGSPQGCVPDFFPVVLATGGFGEVTDFVQIIQYFAPVLSQGLQGGSADPLLKEVLCSEAMLNEVVPNPRHGFRLPTRYFGGDDCEQYALLAMPPPNFDPTHTDGCKNFHTMLKATGILYFENSEIVLNDMFDIKGGWNARAVTMSTQTQTVMSVTWFSVVSPELGIHGGKTLREASQREMARKQKTQKHAAQSIFLEVERSTTSTLLQDSLNSISDGQSSPSKSPELGADTVGITHFEKLLIKNFPAFPIETLGTGLPLKYAYMLHNYMSHVSYVTQCCYRTVAGKGNMSHCPFCVSNPDLCPCVEILFPGEPTIDFVFPVMTT